MTWRGTYEPPAFSNMAQRAVSGLAKTGYWERMKSKSNVIKNSLSLFFLARSDEFPDIPVQFNQFPVNRKGSLVLGRADRDLMSFSSIG